MELIKLKIKDIKPYENNPRLNDEAVDAVAESIKQCGYVAPIIVDEDHIILAGHTRLKALKKLNREEVDVLIREGLTEEQKRKYRILDNKTNEFAEWDIEKLTEEIEGLDFDGFDFGLDLGEEEEEKEVVEDNYNEPIPPEPKSKLGQVYRLGNHRLMCGDSTSESDVSKLCADKKMDLLVTDPPYGVDYVGKTKDALTIQNDAKQDGDFLEFLSAAFKAADAQLKPGGRFIYGMQTQGLTFSGKHAT